MRYARHTWSLSAKPTPPASLTQTLPCRSRSANPPFLSSRSLLLLHPTASPCRCRERPFAPFDESAVTPFATLLPFPCVSTTILRHAIPSAQHSLIHEIVSLGIGCWLLPARGGRSANGEQPIERRHQIALAEVIACPAATARTRAFTRETPRLLRPWHRRWFTAEAAVACFEDSGVCPTHGHTRALLLRRLHLHQQRTCACDSLTQSGVDPFASEIDNPHHPGPETREFGWQSQERQLADGQHREPA